ncbi:hypothetical protein D3C76_898770 [compost metagenome]
MAIGAQGRAGLFIFQQLGKLIAQRVARQCCPAVLGQRDRRDLRGLRLITTGNLQPQPFARVRYGRPPVMDWGQPFAHPGQFAVGVQHLQSRSGVVTQKVRMPVSANDNVGLAQMPGELGGRQRADYPAAYRARCTLLELPLKIILGRDIGTGPRTEQPRACCSKVAELGLLQQRPAAFRVMPGEFFPNLG